MAWENGLGKSRCQRGSIPGLPGALACVEQFLVSPESCKRKQLLLWCRIIVLQEGRTLAPLQQQVFMCFAVTLEEFHHGSLLNTFPGVCHLGFPMLSFWEGKDSVISSALCECSFFRHSPGTKNQILPSPSSFLLCVFPYQKSQQEEAPPCEFSTSVIFSNFKLRTMPRTLPSRRTVLDISE